MAARLTRLCASLAMLGGLLAAPAVLNPPAAHAAAESAGASILDTAETRAGDWYSYGSAGPGYFDCSGLVYWAAAQHGITLPRTTYGMLAGSAHLEWIPLSQARRGDLLFYGSGHVEFATIWSHVSFGAHDTGTRVGWIRWGGSWAPTEAMRIR